MLEIRQNDHQNSNATILPFSTKATEATKAHVPFLPQASDLTPNGMLQVNQGKSVANLDLQVFLI